MLELARQTARDGVFTVKSHSLIEPPLSTSRITTLAVDTEKRLRGVPTSVDIVTVTLQRVPSCDCGHSPETGQQTTELCLHVVYCLHIVLDVKPDLQAPIYANTVWSAREVRHIMEGSHANQLNVVLTCG
jgi:hypothetical protein